MFEPNIKKVLTYILCICGFADSGNPLILTPLIEANKIQEAQNASKVTHSAFGNISSYSGYFTVNEFFNSNMFFWFFPSENDFKTDPVILWLQGGPGASSMFALFVENGPIYLDSEDLKVKFRQYSWTKNHSVLYIDNPVGSGFSYTNGGLAENETKVGEDLYRAITQFYKLFPELQVNDLFISGESYAGKFIPAIAYTIYKNNLVASLQIPLKGLLIGNGICDPENQFYLLDEYLYQIGMIDSESKAIFTKHLSDLRRKIKRKDFNGAFMDLDILFSGDFANVTYYENLIGLSNFYNYLTPKDPYGNYYEDFLNRADAQEALHIRQNTTFATYSTTVRYKFLRADFMDSVRPWIEELLSHMRILFYNGQLDVIVAYPTTVNMIKKLNFSSTEEYKKAKRNLWYVDDAVAGYTKTAGNLTECLVRNAGHLVPQDQPKIAYDLVYKFIRNRL